MPWLQLWTDLVAEASKWLPDVDMPINYWDESRILTPWDQINSLVAEANRNARVTPINDTKREYTRLERPDAADPQLDETRWITDGAPQFWNVARMACGPDTPGHNVSAIQDFSNPPSFPSDWQPSFSENGFVKNYTASMDPCLQPHLRGMSGAFVQWGLISTTQELIPMFGGCKLPMNNDILIPGAMYLSGELRYSGGWNHGPNWGKKEDGIIWRGVASGGRHQTDNWSHFQRFRLVQMLNGTTVSDIERHHIKVPTFEMPPMGEQHKSYQGGTIGEWLTNNSDAGFTALLCYPEGECGYLEPYFSEVGNVLMASQYRQKYMPDVDGNSFSARFRSLLLSTSLPLKSTIYAEWHDDRLAPWVHFAPLDNTLQDLYGVLGYFLEDQKGDAAAEMLAETGRLWAEKVLRREDMLLYVWRVLLEFARVCDEDRDRLGFVDDLI